MSSVLFIGLGHMGLPMALNLKNKKFDVTGFDINQEALTNFTSQEGKSISSLESLSPSDPFDFVISMLPSGAHVKQLFVSKQKVFEKLSSKTLVIDCSTIDVQTSQSISKKANEHNLNILDAPVSGGTKGAKDGTLTFIVGGNDSDLEKATPLLEAMGKNIFRAGSNGMGQAAKMCNNLLLAIHMIGTAEALKLGEAVGLEPKTLSKIMMASSGKNWSLELYNPCPDIMPGVPASKSYEGGFAVDLMVKDLTLAMEAPLSEAKATLPLGKKAFDLYKTHQQNGWGKKDFSSIFKLDSQT